MHVSARTLVAMFSVLLGTACGGGAASSNCTVGQASVPRGAGDPCKQDGTACAAMQGTGKAMCQANGTWGQCVCDLPKAAATAPTVGTQASAVASCGNLVVEPPGEQCEANMINTSCAALMGTGSTGTVACKNCKFDMSACTAMMTPMGGSGASMPVGGAGH
jgi:hypothetical protein